MPFPDKSTRPKLRWRAALLAVLSMMLSSPILAAPPNAIMLVAGCGGCHGVHGVSAGVDVPSLAGQRKEAFVAAMKAYKKGERPATVMGRLAQGYSDDETATMGEYYAAQRPVRQTGAVDAKLAEKGKAIYYRQCRQCHLDNRELWGLMHQRGEYDRQCGNCHAKSGPDAKDDIPVIAGQWLGYVRTQLQDFKDGRRKMAEAKARKLKPLSRDELEALAHFVAAQPAE